MKVIGHKSGKTILLSAREEENSESKGVGE
jgi:hypothetical protein